MTNYLFNNKDNIVNIINKKRKPKNLPAELDKGKSLIVWGSSLGSGLAYPLSFTAITRSMYLELPKFIFSVIIGLLLSDGWIGKGNISEINARLELHQSLANFNYLWAVFLILSPFCSTVPYFRKSFRNGIPLFSLNLYTRALPCFTIIWKMFYLNRNKIIPLDIFHYLTPVALAHWIMGDGAKYGNGLQLCTDSYSLNEVTLLLNVLIIRYRFNCSIRTLPNNKYRIIIKSSSMNDLRNAVSPFMVFSMMYKINKTN